MNKKVKNMVGIAIFTAIVVVLQLLGGGIKVGSLFSISLVLIPIVVGSAVYGWYAGPWLGLVFGFAVLLSGDANAFLAVDPYATVLVVLAKGVLCGLVCGLVYRFLSRWNNTIAVIAAAIVCPMVNTGVFLLGCWLFFFDTIAQWAAAYGFADATEYMFLGLAGINFLVELGINIVLAPVIQRIIKIQRKR